MTSAVDQVSQSQTTYSSSSNTATDGLGKDDFLKLLVDQLRYQNPMEPMKDTDFIAQMAQFSSLEQMKNLNTSMETLMTAYQLSMQDNAVSYAVSLIGKEVGYLDGQSNQWGKVESIQIVNGIPLLVVGDWLIELDQVFEVKPVVEETEEVQEETEEQEETEAPQEEE